MSGNVFRIGCLALGVSWLAIATATAADPPRPNIIVILADDMGYSDLGCFGGEIRTPNLDRLAAGGLRFTQFYNTARCCPTRACLLSGLYPHQTGVGHMMEDRGHDGYRGDLNRKCATIGETLRPAGYGTYAVGKWHVTRHIQPNGPKHNWPRQRGFDRFYGTITGAGSFFDPGTLTRDNTNISPLADPEYQPSSYYYTDAIADHAIRFVGEHCEKRRDDPFFLYVAFTAAHWPMHAREEDIAKYRGQYDDGYDAIRAARMKRMRELGLVKPEWAPAPTVGDWSKQSDSHRAWEIRCMEVYAAMIDRMDHGIGRLMAELQRRGQFDNTLIMFLQDNGGCQETVGRQGRMTRPDKPTLPPIAADAIRLDVIPKQDRAGVPTLQGSDVLPGPADTYIAYGVNWANVSNTPFREYKHFVHEGGISTPLIAHWPRGISRHNELEPQPGHLIDLMATCVDVGGAEYPPPGRTESIPPLEGRSLAPAFAGRTIERDAMCWEHEGNRAIRDGDWKLVAKDDQPWELYDLAADRTEQRNLAAAQSDRVATLAAKWEVWARRVNVLPLGTWKAKPAVKPMAKPAANSTAKPAARPNVLLLCVDDLKPLLGCYGDEVVKSPNIDRLAQRGMLFQLAYCNQAVCSPSRNALLTGLRPQSLGIYDLATNFRKARPDAITLPQWFQRQGYRTEALGKIFHVGHGNHEDAVSWSVPHFQAKSIGYAVKENLAEPTREGAFFDNKSPANLPKGAAYESADVEDSAYGDGKIADEAVRRLRAAQASPGEPIFLAVGFLKPHLPFCAPKKYWDLYDRSAFKLAERRAPPAGAPSYAPQFGGELRNYKDIPAQGALPDDLQRTLIHGYHAATSYMDAQLGRVLTALDDSGLAQNTIIVLWGDHGWHLGDHGMWCKHTNYEQAARIPLIVVAPDAVHRGEKTRSLTESVDIYPTLCELAGLPAPRELDGRSFAAVIRDPRATTRESVIHVYPRGPRLGRAIRTARYRLVEWKKPGASSDTAEFELYDYESDPLETRNLAADQPEVVQQLRILLAQHPEAKAPIAPGSKPDAATKAKSNTKPAPP